MTRRALTTVALALVLLASACSDKKDTPNSAIGTDDAPATAGPQLPTSAPTTVPGGPTTTAPGQQIKAPWPAPTRDVTRLIARAGLPALTGERLEYHLHSHLDVFVDGRAQAVPANLGIDLEEQPPLLSPLHTHDETGIIHVENDKPDTFRLGQLFSEWDVRLDALCVGAYCRATTPVKYYVDGKEFTGDPQTIEFARHRQIAIVIGTPPRKIPDKYDWPSGV